MEHSKMPQDSNDLFLLPYMQTEILLLFRAGFSAVIWTITLPYHLSLYFLTHFSDSDVTSSEKQSPLTWLECGHFHSACLLRWVNVGRALELCCPTPHTHTCLHLASTQGFFLCSPDWFLNCESSFYHVRWCTLITQHFEFRNQGNVWYVWSIWHLSCVCLEKTSFIFAFESQSEYLTASKVTVSYIKVPCPFGEKMWCHIWQPKAPRAIPGWGRCSVLVIPADADYLLVRQKSLGCLFGL